MHAAYISINFAGFMNGEEDSLMATVYDGPRCWEYAEALKRGLKRDWPEHHHFVVCDEEAAAERGEAFVAELFGEKQP